jgi:glycerate 2-kinase
VVAVAGRLQLSPAQLREAGISAAYALTDLEPDLDRCIANARPLLRTVGAQIATDWLA